MGKIRLLPDVLADRIAAGEVVERPASVAKELLENALDAGASDVRIAIEHGGRSVIIVDDDGEGMDRDDALLALERHATSKLERAEDLAVVATLGFRGEALPAIASVSRLTLTTASDDSGEACRVVVRGGTLCAAEPASRRRGTTVEVRDLFFNTPARRKFLRSEAAETQRLVEAVCGHALARPDVRLTLETVARRLILAPAARDLRARVAQLFGGELADSLLPVVAERGGLALSGLVAPAGQSRPGRSSLYVWINRRPVRDRVLQHALVEGYAESLPRGRHPVAFLGLEMPPAQVDVNVHPAKAEVRFAHGAAIHDLVREAVTEALRREEGYGRAPRAWTFAPERDADGVAGPSWADPAAAQQALPPLREGWSRPARPASGGAGEARADDSEAGGAAFALAQYRNCYILGRDERGLLLVDQHTAHERVLFERLLDDAASGDPPRQTLLFPVTVDLSPAERVAIESEREALERLGFGLEGFGGPTIVVRELPVACATTDAARLVGEVARALAEQKPLAAAEEARRRAAATAACHAAVRINDPLTPEKMDAILAGVLRCRTPTHCPHGRPVMLRITLEEIERAFGRTWGPR